ncbi:alpha/beta hydrolase [Rhodococcus spelaei]|uniref:Alpha/beta hydrolase n=1 Tax=Rhodococcus spelaei TaxID=2546320 RepID=A0A541BQL3_9NOCA|nr:alpha/beta hydrolase [Rhodococcus spelaei]TQF74585.1 alpha/beta hydrolase [Rhodococcus spelaei]
MSENAFDPALRLARFLPRSVVTPRTAGPIRRLTRLAGAVPPKHGDVVRVDADVTVRVFRPRTLQPLMPGLLFVHGGGYLIGSASMGDSMCRRVANDLGAVAVSVEYRLAPEYPFPTPLEDCYAGLRWLADQPDVDASRIAIAGESAGGGLAAALALLARDRGEIEPAFQLLSYPMLDDRTAQRTDIDGRRLRVWSVASNRYGWRAYLGGAADVPPLAAPARYGNLAGLPPAWIGVGTHDLFHDEDVAYAARLNDARVPCALHVVPGAYHGFDLVDPRSATSRAYRQEQMRALAAALGDAYRARP